MNRMYLSAWFSLISVGWLLGFYWNQIVDRLLDWFDADDDMHVAPPRSNVRYLRRPYDWSQESETA